jgi:hypothetical protein
LKIFWTYDNPTVTLHDAASTMLSLHLLRDQERAIYASPGMLELLSFLDIEKHEIKMVRHINAWAWPKLKTMRHLQPGDIHIDNDLFFLKGIPDFDRNKDFVFQSFESTALWPVGYQEGLVHLVNILGYLPEAYKPLMYKEPKDFCAFNHGFWYVNNLDILHRFCDEADQLYEATTLLDFNKGSNVTLEQHLFYAYCQKHALNIGTLLPSGYNTEGNIWDGWNADAKDLGYVHVMKGKLDTENQENLCREYMRHLPKEQVDILRERYEE